MASDGPMISGHPMSRRRWLSTAAAGGAAMLAPTLLQGQTRRRRPNVVLIVADDLGSTDLGCYGAADLPTPNLDQLAAGGIRFTQFYVAAPACTASRASLLTGRHHPRILHYGIGLEREEVTLAEILRSEGYRTGVFGKWHLGVGPDVSPENQGFDEFLGFKVGAIDNYSHYFYWGTGARHALWKNDQRHAAPGHYFPDLVTDAALDFIRDNQSDPFFLYLPYNLPHYPLQPDPATATRCAGIEDPARRRYAACVATLDDCVGRVLRTLDETGLRQDTIIIFLSDHGHSEEHDSLGGGGRSTPFRGTKGTLLEGGIRVPCIASWPGHLTAGGVRTQPVPSIDWVPTLAGYCGASLDGLAVDGLSLSGLLASAAAAPTHDALHWVWQKGSAVRQGPWKLVAEGLTDVHLYNLDSDPGETTDLVSVHRNVTQRLIELRKQWVRRLSDDETVRRWYGG